MFYNEHGVAHFHAVYGEHEATIEIECERVHGYLPARALALALNGAGCIDQNYWRTGGVRVPASPWSEFRLWSNPMDYHVLEARYIAGYTVWLRFRDGTTGEVDLASALRGPVFAPLQELAYFRQYTIHPEFHTLIWPNGADIAPEYLHQQARVAA